MSRSALRVFEFSRDESPSKIASLFANGVGRFEPTIFAHIHQRTRNRIVMADHSPETPIPVRIIGSRELHQNLPAILKELKRDDVRFVLTVHGKPRAVLVGAEAYLKVIRREQSPSEALVGLQLSALLGGGFNALTLDDLEKALDQKPDGSE